MRKNNTIALAALSVLVVAFSCAKEKDVTPTEQATPAQEETVAPEQSGTNDVELVPFSFSIAETKTYIDDSGTSAKVVWEEGESIAVYDGFGIRQFTMTSLDPLKFEGEIAAEASFAWAVYPYAESGISATASTVTASLPATQVLSGEKNAAKGALLTAGKINMENKSVTLLNLHGLVSFTIGHDDIAALSVKGTNLAGSATFTEGGVLSGEVSSPESEIVLTPDGETFTNGSVVYIAAFPGATITAVSAKRTDGYKGTKSGLSKTLARNKGLNAGTLDNMAIEWVYEAANADELLAWHAGHTEAAMTAAKADYPNATNHKLLLTGDIDMSGKTWGHKSLYCEFDGAGHKIYNLVIERNGSKTSNGATFLTNLEADIHDVIFGSSDGTSYDGTSAITNTVTGSTGWQYACLFQTVPENMTIKISNIVNFIPVSNTESATGKFRYAAILGYSGNAGSKITVLNCKNYGNVYDKTTAESIDNNIMGGVVGIFSTNAGAEITIEGCENYGTVHSVQPKTFSMGGILGRTGAGKTTKMLINNCHNYGDVIYAPATYSTTILRVGGIVGDSRMADDAYLDGSEYRHVISNCTVGYKPVPAGKTQTEINVTGKVFTVGGVTGWLAGTDLSFCSNYANVTVAAGVKASQASTPVGGIAGTVGYANPYENEPANETAATAKVNGCRNEGTVSATLNINSNGGNSGNAGGVAGGIAGCAKGYAEFKNNINTGNVNCDNTNSTATYSFGGGIAGYIYNTHNLADPQFSGNKNSGTITVKKSNSGTSGTSKCAGGVVGKLVGSITDCHNYGTVSGSNNMAGAIVGFIRPNAAAHQLIITDCVVGQGVKVHGVTVTAENAGITPTGYDQGKSYTWDGSTLKITAFVGYNTTAEGKYTGLFFGQCNSSGSGTATLSGASTVATAPTL